MIPTERFPTVEVSSVGELRGWLAANHSRSEAVWLVTYRKSTPAKYLSTDQVLDELVAFGWIDGLRRKIDDEQTMQLISPRRTKPWARSYRVRAERLIAEGRMQPPGLAGIEVAKASGDWDAMAEVDDVVVPADLQAALAAEPPAEDVFSAFPPSVKRNILRWVTSAKTTAARTKRIAATVSEAREGRRVRSNG